MREPSPDQCGRTPFVTNRAAALHLARVLADQNPRLNN